MRFKNPSISQGYENSCLYFHLNVLKFCVICVFFFSFIFISWRLFTLQYCSGFCHTLIWISHGFTCIPHPDPPSHQRDRLPPPVFLDFPESSAGKESACNAGDLGSTPGLGRSPREGNGYPTHSSILAWRIPWGCKESDMTEWLTLHFTLISWSLGGGVGSGDIVIYLLMYSLFIMCQFQVIAQCFSYIYTYIHTYIYSFPESFPL